MYLQYLSDVHTGRYAEGVQYDIEGTAIRQERHILFGQNTGNDTLITVTACHLIADLNLTLLGNIAVNDLIDTGCQFITGLFMAVRTVLAFFLGKHFDINNNAVFAMRHTQRGITHFSGLFTEDGTQQSFFGGQFGFALGGYLTDQNITGVYLSADTDNTVFIEITELIVTDIRNITGDFLRTELGISGFDLILFDMNRSINVVTHDFLVNENGILVVIAFPGHEADEGILAEADFTIAGSRAVS